MPSAAEGRKRVLLLALDDWAVAHYLCRNLVKTGLDVRALFPPGSVLNHTSFLPPGGRLSLLERLAALLLAAENRFGQPTILRPLGWLSVWLLKARLVRLMAGFPPDFLIPVDERAVRLCRDLTAGRGGALSADLAALLTRSLGNPATLGQRLARAGNHDAACAAGIRVPRQIAVVRADDARTFAREVGYPVVLKRDHSAGGVGVRICHDAGALDAALVLFYRGASTAATSLVSLTIQQFAPGVPAMREVFCWEGQAVAGFSLIKVESYPNATGAASVVRAINNPEMEVATARLVAQLGLSGFADVDFMVDETDGRAYCIELNARPTGLTHLGSRMGSSLEQALYAKLTGNPVAPSVLPPAASTVAIFPKELLRDPDSKALRSGFHDVPWDDPEVIAYYLARSPGPSLRRCFG